jgi:hypothetical protein
LCFFGFLDQFLGRFDRIKSADLMKAGNKFCFCLNLTSKLAIDIIWFAEVIQMETSCWEKAQTLVLEFHAR